ncbi:MAG: multicopper oxidase family protein [Proteobacteria bacterium]|nr:multicopper oxidase family protein [Pseudomonadota bacterium]
MDQPRKPLIANRCRLRRREFLCGVGASFALLAQPSRVIAKDGASAAQNEFRVVTARTGYASLLGASGPPTDIWGYDGTCPGPLLKVRRGEEMKVRLVNALPEPTTIHWHGLRLRNAMDGAPNLTQLPVPPGSSFDYRFTARDSGTFWYHSHENSSEQLARGLYGLLIVEEPHDVGVDRDIALVVDDWRLSPDGSIDTAFRSMRDASREGKIGDHFTANGSPLFDIPVATNERLRLRLVNAANARIMALRVDRHEPTVMALDGQPAEPFVAREARVALGPGNRADLFIDARLAPGSTSEILLDTGMREVAIARLVYAHARARAAPLGDMRPLPANPLPERMDFAGALKLDVALDGGMMGMMGPRGLAGGNQTGQTSKSGPGTAPSRQGYSGAAIWSLARRASDGHSARPLFSVKRGRTVVLAFANRTAFPHAMHIHGHHFRLLDRLDDGWKPFWLDTVVVPAGQTWRIAFVADNPGKWMLHCHMLEHQETGMATWFEVG